VSLFFVLKVNEFLSRKGNAPNCEAWFGLTARGEFNPICDQHALDFMKVGFGHRSPILYTTILLCTASARPDSVRNAARYLRLNECWSLM
jgi:hypothetical protein